ncbi:MAG: CHAD domain-containing protein [Xanthobacteraceae bacterium]|nr:MAG: CHAD domain-containing protein [Xanthobacteraceae bacterium]
MKAADETPGTPLLPSLRHAANDTLARAAQSLEAAAGQPDPATAIHDFRVAMKRWRALLRLLQGIVGDETVMLRRQAGRLARPLGRSRDAQAALTALEDLSASDTAPATMQAAAARLNDIRKDSERAALDPATLQRLRAGLARAAEACANWPLDTVAFDDIAEALTRSYRRARRRMPADWDAATAGDIHAFRKAVVIFRYQMETVEPLWPRLMRAYTSEAQKLRMRLGRSNDLLVLENFLRPRRPLASWRKRLVAPLQARRRRHLAAAALLAARVFADKPRMFRQRLTTLGRAAALPQPPAA